jgi:hypothetical protein
VPAVADVPAVPVVPAVADVPPVPDAPAVADVPAAPVVPPVADVPAVPEEPAVADVPAAPVVPPVADVPAAPFVPAVADVPAVPVVPPSPVLEVPPLGWHPAPARWSRPAPTMRVSQPVRGVLVITAAPCSCPRIVPPSEMRRGRGTDPGIARPAAATRGVQGVM